MTIAAISATASPVITISQPKTTSAIRTGAMARPTASANWRESDPADERARAMAPPPSAARAHGANRYPRPHTVWMWVGRDGSASSLARSRRMWTVTVEVSL